MTLVWLAIASCAKIERSPDEQTVAGAAGMGNGGSGDGGRTPSAAAAGKPASSGAAGTGGAASGGGAASSGGTAGSGEGPLLAGTSGSLGGGPTSTEGGGSSAGGSPGCHYEACGCGCCIAPNVPVCVYPGVGSTFDEIVAADIARRTDTVGCAAAGCSVPRDYLCCVEPPPSAESASYETSVYIGGYDRVRLQKTGAVNCSTLVLVAPKLAGRDFPVELPTQWTLEQITRARCISSATQPSAIGAIGKFSFRVSGDACVVDAHLTAFFPRVDGGVDAERFDAEGVPVNLSIGQCK